MGSCVKRQSRLANIDAGVNTHIVCQGHAEGMTVEKPVSRIDDMFKEIESIYQHSFNFLPRLKIGKSSLYIRRKNFLPQMTGK